MQPRDPLKECERCGGRMIIIQEHYNPGIARCSSCGHEIYFCFDGPLPEPSNAEDTRDAVLRLEDAGLEPLAVAVAIRSLTGLTAQAALTLVWSCGVEIARRNHWRIWELEDLQTKLQELGARTNLIRC